jgi:hypothetical protein
LVDDAPAPVTTLRVTPETIVAPVRKVATRTPVLTLDEAIRNYLEEFATTTAATARST